MKSFLSRFLGVALSAGLLSGVLAVPVHAQAVPRVYPNTHNMIDPNPLIAPGLTLRQYAYNTSVIGNAYSTIPPYVLGYNPYIRNQYYGPVYVPPSYPYYYGVPYYTPYNYNLPYGYNLYNIGP